MSKERAASLIFAFFGLYGFVFSVRLPLGSWREPGPGVLPLGVSLLLIASGLLWFVCGRAKTEATEKLDWKALRSKILTPAKIIGLTLLFVMSLNVLGYLIAASLYVFVLFFWVSEFKFHISIGLALVIGGGSWYFFAKILSVQLP